MDSAARPLEDLHTFRNSLYRCFERRADALFELADALLTAGTVPWPVHLSLVPAHRRGGAASMPPSATGKPKKTLTQTASPARLRGRHEPTGP
jgi:hypothetical protein